MLQTAVEDACGVVSWRGVTCEDEDDFVSLWVRRWAAEDFVAGDPVLFIPEVKPAAWVAPTDMVAASARGEVGGGVAILGRVLSVEVPSAGSHAGEVDAVDVIGRHTSYESRLTHSYNTRSKARLAGVHDRGSAAAGMTPTRSGVGRGARQR